jgi:hypothetical protein
MFLHEIWGGVTVGVTSEKTMPRTALACVKIQYLRRYTDPFIHKKKHQPCMVLPRCLSRTSPVRRGESRRPVAGKFCDRAI